MKFLVLLMLTAVASAAPESNLLQDAQPLLQKLRYLPLQLQRSRSGQSLAEALDLPPSTELDSLETKIRIEFGQLVSELAEEALWFVANSTADANAEIVEILNLLKERPTEESAQKFIDRITALQDRRLAIDYILDQTFEEDNFRVYTWYSVEERGIKSWLKKGLGIKSWLKGLGAKISNKFSNFKKWAEKTFKKYIDDSKPETDQLKDLAKEFLKQNWDKIAIKTVEEGLGFFHPMAGKLGGLLVEGMIKLARHFNLVPWERFYGFL